MKKTGYFFSVLILLLLFSPINNVMASNANLWVYRLYSPITHEHLYTMDVNERDTLANNGWNYEGDCFSDFPYMGEDKADSYTAVYRLNNDKLQRHLYTSDKNEIESLKQQGWTVDGNGQGCFYYYNGGGEPVYRLYHPGEHLHILTADVNEYNALAAAGWRREGVKFFCYDGPRTNY